MPEIPSVNTGGIIASEWGNAIRDRTIQRYANAAERATEHPSPSAGDLSYLADTGDVDVFGPGGWMHTGPPVGSLQMHAGGSIPNGWLNCNGQAVSRTTHAALFAQIGTIWGNGDGSTTFNLPDLRGRTPRGVAASGTGNAVGQTFGSDNHTHTGPSHTHSNPNVNSGGNHDHSSGSGSGSQQPSGAGSSSGRTSTDGAHVHSQSNTGPSGTGNTGSASTIQAGAAVVMLIKT